MLQDSEHRDGLPRKIEEHHDGLPRNFEEHGDGLLSKTAQWS